MIIAPYLIFRDQARAAFTFYAKALRGEIKAMLTFNDVPADAPASEGEGCAGPIPDDFKDKIMHVALEVNGQLLMASDCPPSQPFEGHHGFMVSLNVDSAEEAARVFEALADNGSVLMPLDKTFWAERFGMLVDQFGISWAINFDQPA